MANALNTITVDGVTYDAEKYAASQTQTRNTNQDLGKEAFLQLLVTQMRYQDPLDPQDNSEYIAELAQFSALEQMTNVSDTLSDMNTVVGNIDTSVLVGQLSSMIGKNIDWVSTTKGVDTEGNPVSNPSKYSGMVTGVTIVEGVPTVTALSGGQTYQVEIADIGRVYEEEDQPQY